MELETDTARIMADHGIIPAETLKPIEVTRAAAGQFGHPADGGLMPCPFCGGAARAALRGEQKRNAE